MNQRRGAPLDLAALSAWAPELAETFVSLASDIALVIDSEGVVRSVSQAGDPLAPEAQQWVGKAWADTVTGDTRGKIDLLLQEVGSTGLARRREVNHPATAGATVPVAYTAIRLGEGGPVLAVGRDLRAVASIQQRFVDAQRELEKGYWKARQAESRYRLLFQVATDAVMVVDADTMEILEANEAASQLLDLPVEQLLGRSATFAFERRSRPSVDELLVSARATGRQAEIRARLTGKVTPISVAATPFRTADAMRLLVRVRSADAPATTSTEWTATVARLVDGASDAVVVTDSNGRVMVANPAFLALAQVGGEAQVKGRPLVDWIAEPQDLMQQLLSQVRQRGIARGLACRLRGEGSKRIDVEMTASLLTDGDQESIGLTMRAANAGRDAQSLGLAPGLRRAIEQVGARLGEAPMPDLLREIGVAVERQLIDLALARCEQDPARTAALLGISRDRLQRRRRRLQD